jgi:hypothetical protein
MRKRFQQYADRHAIGVSRCRETRPNLRPRIDSGAVCSAHDPPNDASQDQPRTERRRTGHEHQTQSDQRQAACLPGAPSDRSPQHQGDSKDAHGFVAARKALGSAFVYPPDSRGTTRPSAFRTARRNPGVFALLGKCGDSILNSGSMPGQIWYPLNSSLLYPVSLRCN